MGIAKFLNLLAVSTAPPPARTQVPLSLKIIFGLGLILAVGLLYYVGFQISIVAIVLIALLAVLIIQYFFPQFLEYTIKTVGILIGGPLIAIVCFFLAWWIVLIAIPLILVVSFRVNQTLGLLLFLLLTGGFVSAFYFWQPSVLFAPGTPMGDRVAQQEENAKLYLAKLSGAPGAIQTAAELQFAKATGGIYESKVDQNAKKQLGIQLAKVTAEDVPANSPFFIFVDLKAEILDQPITVQYKCSVDNVPPTSYLHPNGQIYFGESDEQQGYCYYEAGLLKPGPKVVDVTVTYPFKTLGYIEGFFIDSETKSSLEKLGVDLKKQYGVVDKPRATTTAGPLALGIAFEATNPLKIIREATRVPVITKFSLSPASGWATPGKMESVDNFIIIVPKEVDVASFVAGSTPITGNKVSCTSLPVKDQPGCDDAKHNLYTLNLGDLAVNKSVLTVRSLGFVNSDNYDSILGAGGFSSKLFRAAAEYTLGLKKQDAFTIKKT